MSLLTTGQPFMSTFSRNGDMSLGQRSIPRHEAPIMSAAQMPLAALA